MLMDAQRDADNNAMVRLQQGEDLALNEIINRWKQPLANYAMRYVGNESDAVDIAQETFVKIYVHRHKYRAGSRFSSWLLTIATNLCRNHTRWRSRHPAVSIDEENDGIPNSLSNKLTDSSPLPGEKLEADEQNKMVKDAVISLPDDLKTAILLYEFEDRSYEEIAEILGCSSKAVEMRLYRARQLLKEKLRLVPY